MIEKKNLFFRQMSVVFHQDQDPFSSVSWNRIRQISARIRNTGVFKYSKDLIEFHHRYKYTYVCKKIVNS